MLRGTVAADRVGMPASHAKVFQEVANSQNCVVSSREVGRMAKGLLLENYATKGFHNKAKSCPWGPMAGFVMADPRFTKNPEMEGQRKDLVGAVHHGGGEIPLHITDDRRKDLEGPLNAMQRVGGNINEMVYQSKNTAGVAMNFVLRRSMGGPGAQGKQLWAVFYGPGEVRLSNNLTSSNQSTAGNLAPVMAMIDPACPADVRKTYRAATTGDYDLFAVFPERKDYALNRQQKDARMVPGTDRFKVGVKTYNQHEDPHLGNLTARILTVRNNINHLIRTQAGYTGGDVVHHSDEAGRPMVTKIDYPFIAFVPDDDEPWCIENTLDFKKFIQALMFQYVVTFNPGWHRHLGISVTPQGNYEV